MSSVSLLVIITFEQTLKQAKCENTMKAKTALAFKGHGRKKSMCHQSQGANNANVNRTLSSLSVTSSD